MDGSSPRRPARFYAGGDEPSIGVKLSIGVPSAFARGKFLHKNFNAAAEFFGGIGF